MEEEKSRMGEVTEVTGVVFRKPFSQHVSEELFQDVHKAGVGPYQRVLHGHEINECNEAIVILASPEDPNNGGASHNYLLCYPDLTWGENGPAVWEVQSVNFQNGPIKEVGTNGVTHEALLTIIKDRLAGFQSGLYACVENEEAIGCINTALNWLNVRTQRRESQGIEGTHEV